MKKISVILAIIFIVLTFSACGTPKYEKPLAIYFDAVEDENAEKYMRVFADPYLTKYLIGSESDTLKSEDDILELMDDLVISESDECKDSVGKNFKFEYEVTRVREFHADDIRFFAKHLEDNYDYDAAAVENVVVLFADYRVSGDKNTEKAFNEEFVMIQVSGEWYISYLFDTLSEVKNAIEETALD